MRGFAVLLEGGGLKGGWDEVLILRPVACLLGMLHLYFVRWVVGLSANFEHALIAAAGGELERAVIS